MTGRHRLRDQGDDREATGDPTANPNRDNDGNGTADECKAPGAGSRCDVYTKKCTLPYRERSVAHHPGTSRATRPVRSHELGVESGISR